MLNPMNIEVADPQLLERLIDKVLALRTNYEPWAEKAICRGHPTPGDQDPWFPNSTNVQAATSICERCPVRPECDAYADEHKIRVGIWGAKSQRARLRSIRESEQATPTQ